MCLGIPGQVVDLVADNADLAMVDVSGVTRRINVALLADEGGIEPGGWVLIHVGFAITKLTPEEARLAQASLQMMAEGTVEQIEAELPSRREVPVRQQSKEVVGWGS
ncbi:MAG: HypC/HybG/HupF family hydrogenase formation chaperone [Acidimicrobiales bacterium]